MLLSFSLEHESHCFMMLISYYLVLLLASSLFWIYNGRRQRSFSFFRGLLVFSLCLCPLVVIVCRLIFLSLYFIVILIIGKTSTDEQKKSKLNNMKFVTTRKCQT